ncbi:MAG: hypothetical protein H7839_05725 [Magnetococcus sp. YQC-5]
MRKMQQNDAQYYGIMAALLAGVLVWGVGLFGFFQHADAFLHDVLVRFSFGKEKSVKLLTLVELNPQWAERSPVQWLDMVDRILELQPKQVVLTVLPPQVAPLMATRTAPFKGKVVLGRALQAHPTIPEQQILEPWPSTISTVIEWAVMAPPPRFWGVARSQQRTLVLGDAVLPVLEAYAAGWPPGADSEPIYGVHFGSGVSTLPRISGEHLLSGGLIPELVTGRTILVGYGWDSRFATMTVPTRNGYEDITLLQFQGFALNTLLTGQSVHPLQNGVRLAVVLFVLLLFTLMSQPLELRTFIPFFLVFQTGWFMMAWAVLFGFGWAVPITEPIAAMIVLFFVFVRRKISAGHLALQRLLLKASGEIRERVAPTSFLETDTPWPYVIHMVDQVFAMTRILFLERVVKDHRVREIIALRCSLEDIQEMRRDYERTPYTTAILEQGPLVVQKYLKDGQDSERQYLVPLVTNGQVLGFWAFGMDVNQMDSEENFLKAIKSYAKEISGLLHLRLVREERKALEQASWNRLIRFEDVASAQRNLEYSVQLLESRLNRLDAIFTSMETAAILYDPFGRMVQINARMSEWTQLAGMAPFQMAAADMIIALSSVAGIKVRGLLRSVVLDNRSFSLPARLPGVQERDFLLLVRPIQRAETKSPSDLERDVLPFQLEGVLLELQDISGMRQLHTLKEKLAGQLNYQLRNDMESILAACSLMGHKNIPAARRDRVATIIHEKVNAIIQAVGSAQNLLEQHMPLGFAGEYPVQGLEILKNVLSSFMALPIIHGRGIQIAAHLPELASLVLAAPGELQDLFMVLLTHLAQDAGHHTTITVRAREEPRTGENSGVIHFDFSNEGYGVPAERFQRLMEASSSELDETFQGPQRAARLARSWNGLLTGTSEVGMGTRFTLTLRIYP